MAEAIEPDWEALAQTDWQRKKWRQNETIYGVCCVYGTPIHREGTYYLRPAYTDGKRWMSARAYREMCLRIGRHFSNRYGREAIE
ncbi:MAG TPA: hypothetical protein PLL64_05865 [Rhodothermales bacterium]|nr:hypothetical protein [Bacteroidota bacterium]HRK73781.1 hypothetical protein [Rhodothermales bacterium]HRR07372.1 hypothetical protein [Rhodothermales bacterium]